ncbi:MAG: MMPL family transporter [Planctomycetes bacterium]|nr:MMPL family transporter [Planctomycetota bacterium]
MNSAIHRACRRFGELLLWHPKAVIGVLLGLVCLALSQLPALKFEFTPAAIYQGSDDLVAFAEEFKQTFGYDEAICLVVLEAIGPTDVLTAEALQWQRDVAAELQHLPHVHGVESLVTLQGPRATLTGKLELQPIVPEGPIESEVADAARRAFDTLPLVRDGLLSVDNRVAGIPVFLDPTAMHIEDLRVSVGAIRQVLAHQPPPAGYRALLSGLPVISVEIVDDLRKDQLTLIPLAGITYLVVLGLMFRRLSGALLPLVAVGMGLSWTMATFAVTGESVNLVTNVLPALLLIIGVSSSVQIVSCYAEQVAAHGGRSARAALATIVHMTPACLLAALTTAIGFASLATAHSVVLRHFGWQAAVGVGYQYLGTLVFLGTLLRFFAPPRIIDHEQAQPGLTTRTVAAAGFAVARHPWLTLCSALAIVAGSCWFGSHVQINSYSVTETFSESHPSVQTLRLVERKLNGLIPLEISLQAQSPEQFLDPETFHRVLEVEEVARELPGVLSVQSYADLFRVVLVHWPGRRVSETDRELVPEGDTGQKRLARTHSFISKFSDSFHFDSYMTSDGRRARIRVRLAEIGSRQTLALLTELEGRLAQIFPPDGPVQVRLTGEAYVNAHTLTTLIHDLFYSLLTASLVIFSLIAIEFRSLRAGLVAALPNLTPLFITLGYMGLRGYDMNVGNVIVFTICLGLADDNTIHLLYRFREELDRTGEVTQAIQRAFYGTGRAILATSLLLVAGTAVLMASNFVPTRRFAELTGVTIIGNLLGVLLLLPACLVLAWRVKSKPAADRNSPEPATKAETSG